MGLDFYKAKRGAPLSSATVIVAASDSLHPERADYVCDGDDDATVIQAAIDTIPEYGSLYLTGSLTLSSYVETSSNNITILGDAILNLANGANCEFIRVSHNGITIKGLTFDGNVDNQTGGYAAIKLSAGVENIEVEGCHFQDMWNAGVKGEGTADNYIVGVSVRDCTANHFRADASHFGGLVYLSYAEKVDISNLRTEDMGTTDSKIDSVKVIHSKEIQISGIRGYEISAHHIFVGFGSENIVISDILMHNKEIDGLESVCIEYAGDDTHDGTPKNKNVLVENVLQIMEAGGNNGVFVWTSDDVTINNCIVKVLSQPILNPFFRFRYLDDATISNCIAIGLVYDYSSHYSVWQSNRVSLAGCHSLDSIVWGWTNPPLAGLWIIESNDITVESCIFSNLPTQAILVGGGETNKRISIHDCIFVDAGMAGSPKYSIYIEANQFNDAKIVDNLFVAVDSSSMRGMYLEDGNTNVTIKDNDFWGTFDNNTKIAWGSVTGLTVRNNTGYTTENSGTATIANGSTSVAVNHGLDVTPSDGDITVTPTGAWGAMTEFYIGNYTSTQFTIYADQDPGQDVTFAWRAVVL